MGLDMYLIGEKSFITDWDNPHNDLMHDGFRVEAIELELACWRKHWQLHCYIGNTFAEGAEPFPPIELTPARLRQVIADIRNHKVSYGKEHSMQRDLAIFEKVLTWLETDVPFTTKEMWYMASW